jgi:hypothetical protein
MPKQKRIFNDQQKMKALQEQVDTEIKKGREVRSYTCTLMILLTPSFESNIVERKASG